LLLLQVPIKKSCREGAGQEPAADQQPIGVKEGDEDIVVPSAFFVKAALDSLHRLQSEHEIDERDNND
jgi:hypothetical protein